MADRICSHDGCERKILGRGLCAPHYSTWHRGQRKYTVICPACGKTAQVAKPSVKHCSYECSMKSVAASKRKMTVKQWMEAGPTKRASVAKLKQCDWCLQLHQEKSKFCSVACSNEKDQATTQFIANRNQQMLFRKSFEDGDFATFFNELRDRVHVDNNNCWIWSKRLKNGYPVVKWGKTQVQVHRLSLEAKHGKPLGTQAAHHICAVPACVNPDHLQPITHRDNVAEMMQRHAYLERIQELTAALASIAPDHPALNRIEVA